MASPTVIEFDQALAGGLNGGFLGDGVVVGSKEILTTYNTVFDSSGMVRTVFLESSLVGNPSLSFTAHGDAANGIAVVDITDPSFSGFTASEIANLQANYSGGAASFTYVDGGSVSGTNTESVAVSGNTLSISNPATYLFQNASMPGAPVWTDGATSATVDGLMTSASQGITLNQTAVTEVQNDFASAGNYSVTTAIADYQQGTLSFSTTVADTAQDILANLGTLEAIAQTGKLIAVDFTDGSAPTLALSYAQWATDATLIGEFSGSYSMTVAGVPAANASGIFTGNSHVVSVSVSDSAANIATSLDKLESLASSGKATSIALTDSGTPILSITATQENQDAAALKLISGNYHLNVTSGSSGSGTTTNVVQLETISSNPNISATGDGYVNAVFSSTVPVSVNTSAGTVSVQDDVVAYGSGHFRLELWALTAPFPTGSQYDSPYGTVTGYRVAVDDLGSLPVFSTGENVSGSLSGLPSGSYYFTAVLTESAGSSSNDGFVADSLIQANTATTYTGGGGPVTITAAEASTVLTESNVTSATVSDNAADVTACIDALGSLASAGKLSSITLTDSGTPVLTVTAAQLSADKAALSDISSGFDLSVTAPSTNTTITGLSGHANTVILSGTGNLYSFDPTGNGTSFTLSGNGVTDQISNVTALQFSDVTDIVASQTPSTAGAVSSAQVTELYGAVFGRTPDVGGLSFYETYARANPLTPFQQYAEWFLASSEYTANTAHNYPQTVAGDERFITDSYSNLLHRTPSASEIAYYENNVIAPALKGLSSGTAGYASAQAAAHAQVLVYFSQSPEFLSDVTVTAQAHSSASHWLVLI